MHLLGIDLETTGVDPKTNAIIEIACIHYNGAEKLSEFNVEVATNSGRKKSLGAMRITKKSHKDIMNNYEALYSENAVDAFTEYLIKDVCSHTKERITIVGHNVSFDINFMKEWLSRHNIDKWDEVFTVRFLDTAVIAEFLRNTGALPLKSLSLDKLAEGLGVEVDKNKLHTALYDVDLTFKCYFKMVDLVRGLYGKEIS